MVQSSSGVSSDAADFRRLFETMPDALFIADDDRRFVDANPAACELLGISRDKILGTRLEEYAEPAHVREAQEQWARLLREGSQDSEQVLKRPDGQLRVVEVRARSKAVRGLHLAVVRDVTERRQADRLLEDRSLLKAVVDHAPVGIALLRGESLVCELVNPALDAMLAGGARVGLPAREIFADVPLAAAAALRAREESGLHMLRDVVVTKDDGATPARCANAFFLALRGPGGRLDRVLVMLVDTTEDAARRAQLESLADERSRLLEKVRTELTERLRAESELRQTEEHLRDAQKLEALGRVAAGVAHDMNNVLSIVVSCAELALVSGTSSGAPPLSPRLLENLASIKTAAERGANVTRQLLAFCRRQPLSPRPTDLGKTVSVMQPLLRRLLPDSISLRVVTQSEVPIVRLDSSQIERVTVNLVSNARDAMPNGGTLEIAVSTIVVDGPSPELPKITPGQYVELVVKDTGIGLTDEARARLFEPFFTTKEPGGGGGLGLAVVFGIVTQSKGHIAVDSTPGRGTQIRLLFPVDDVIDAPVESSPDSKLLGGSETILLAEDDEAVRQIAARVLRGLGYEVLEAADGSAAIALLEVAGARVQLLLSDVVMPGMDGCALAERVRPRWPHIRVVLMSGYNELVSAFADVDGPGYLFLQKPFTPALLASKAREALETEAARAS